MLCDHESNEVAYKILLVILHVIIIIALRSGNPDTKLLKLNYFFIRNVHSSRFL